MKREMISGTESSWKPESIIVHWGQYWVQSSSACSLMVRVMGHSVPSVAFVTPNWEEWLAPQRVLVPPKVPGRLEQWAGKSLVQIHKDKCGEEQPQEPGGMPGWRGVCRTR